MSCVFCCRQVEVEVEQCDKGGNFIGWLYFDGKNLSTSLVTEGLCKVLPQAERSVHAKELFDMEEKAKAARKKIWKVSLIICRGILWRLWASQCLGVLHASFVVVFLYL